MSTRNDVAIYAPKASAFYERPSNESLSGGGGAELQTTLLARTLARAGLRVAQIVYPVESLVPPELPSLEIVQRSAHSSRPHALGKVGEIRSVWRALANADARLYLFRIGISGAFVLGALFCLLHRRRLVLAGSNDLDFTFRRPDRSRSLELLYRLALARTQHVVVQTQQQLELARGVIRDRARITLIPSFAEPAWEAPAIASPEAFLWVGRLVESKLPLRFVEVARALPEARFLMIAPRTAETPLALERELREEVAQTPNLELLSPMRREKLLELIARSVAVVATSDSEGMPNVFLEAWSRSVPVLSLHFDPDGRIAREQMGMCAGGDWQRFLSEVSRLWGDRELRDELGENGRRYVARFHSVEAVGSRWTETLRAVLDS